MRFGFPALLIVVVVFLYMCLYLNSPDSHASTNPGIASSALKSSGSVDFDKQVKPIFQSQCQPCHFSGGVMYDRLPFDRPQTIRKLGTKLLSRIKDENEQRVISEFLEQ